MEDELIIHNSSGLRVDDSVSISKRNPTSIINWQIEEPKEAGYFIVTDSEGKVKIAAYSPFLKGWYFQKQRIYNIVAWCSLSNIEPYK